ncbi:MAG TPA: PepSY-associated TM helix domain-containing protein, partial [Rhodothermales bacterium]|nr:PepSY-associated TM helix domain-containing protein [Rhodothermales bacterium]
MPALPPAPSASRADVRPRGRGPIRRTLRWLHLVVGLTAGLVLVPMGLSGSLLVFRPEIDAAMYPALHRVSVGPERAPLDSVMAAVRQAYPSMPVSRIDYAARPEGTLKVVLADSRTVFADPYTARLLGAQGPTESFTGVLFDLHHHLLMGEAGEQATGYVGLALVFLVISGLVLWWRGWRNARLRVRWRRSPHLVSYDLHNVVGAVASVFLLITAVSGAGLVFHDAFDATAVAVTGEAMPAGPPKSTPMGSAAPAALARLVAQAQAAIPSARVARVIPAGTPEAAVLVRMRLPTEIHPIGMSRVYLDAYSGEVLRVM